ncbi:putative monooxygenase [Mycena venus]|uniref:Putative monooxygenase n=1 Tax=Mycena venus TaxID=2733690 RepID=A0A8H6YQD4_9AGAR|nr:putative monooxygenase [Mycena venus]
MNILRTAATSGVWMVDTLPILKRLPSWLPGTGSLALARLWRQLVFKAVWAPYTWSKRSFDAGTVLLPNTCATALENMNESRSADREDQLVWAAGTMTVAGHETDDVYQGMHLPEGVNVVANIWLPRHMLHDPEVFTNPMKFDPDRYLNLDSEMEKVTNIVFGFGRRQCPGKSLAENITFAIAATVLATCDIVPKLDEDGNDVIPNVVYTSGIFR